MKIPPPNRERGAVAVVIMLASLAFLLVLVNANSTNVSHLNRELHRLDERQMVHWSTNTAAAPPRP